MTIKLQFGDMITILRKRRGWQVQQLAVRAKISKGYLSLLENGQVSNPTLQVLLRLCVALSTDPNTLLAWDKPEGSDRER